MLSLVRKLPAGDLFWKGATLFLSNGIGQALGFLGSVAIARLLGVQSFGLYAAIMALVFVLGLLVEAGMETTLTREIAAAPGHSARLLGQSIAVKLWLGGAVSLLLALPPLATLLSPDPSVQIAVQISGPLVTLTAINSSFGAVFRAWGRMGYVLLINVVGLGVQLVGTLVILSVFRSLTLLFAWLIAIQVLELFMGAAMFQRQNGAEAELEGVLVARTRSCPTDLLKRSWPFALAGVLGALTLRVDLFLIETFRGASQVGIYSVGTRLTDLLALAPNSLFAALLPAMASRHSDVERSPTSALYPSSVQRMFMAGIVLAVFGLLFADVLVWVCFGPAYSSAAGPLRILVVTLVPLLVNRTTTVYLYATHREHKANRALGVDLGLRAVAGVLLVPLWGAVGAATAGLASECAVLVFYSLTNSMGSLGLRDLLRGVTRSVLALRYRGFKPGQQADHYVRVAGLRLHVPQSVFDPKVHFTSAFLSSYLRQPGVVLPGSRVLDLGTGSGIAAISAALAGASQVVATDVNGAAVRSAGENTEHHKLSHQVVTYQGDMFAPVQGEKFDLIISNPPYLRGIAANIAEEAYYGGSGLEWFERFASEAPSYLLPDGWVLMILGDIAETENILDRFRSKGWEVHLAAHRELIVEGLSIYKLWPAL